MFDKVIENLLLMREDLVSSTGAYKRIANIKYSSPVVEKLWKKLIKETPVPVVLDAWGLGSSGREWIYDDRKKKILMDGPPDDIITEEDIAALLHEKVHAIHHEKGCICYSEKSDMLAEYHACRESLIEALNIGNSEIIKFVLDEIEKTGKYPKYDAYRKAYEKLLDEDGELLKRARRYV